MDEQSGARRRRCGRVSCPCARRRGLGCAPGPAPTRPGLRVRPRHPLLCAAERVSSPVAGPGRWCAGDMARSAGPLWLELGFGTETGIWHGAGRAGRRQRNRAAGPRCVAGPRANHCELLRAGRSESQLFVRTGGWARAARIWHAGAGPSVLLPSGRATVPCDRAATWSMLSVRAPARVRRPGTAQVAASQAADWLALLERGPHRTDHPDLRDTLSGGRICVGGVDRELRGDLTLPTAAALAAGAVPAPAVRRGRCSRGRRAPAAAGAPRAACAAAAGPRGPTELGLYRQVS